MSQDPKQHQILFVDDDPVFLETISNLFNDWSEHAWQIHAVSTVDQALALLKKRKVDLVVVDANMPVVDGLQFLRMIHHRHPDLKKAVLTGYATDKRRSDCLSNGAELFIEKPREPEGWRSVFAMLDELLHWTPDDGFHGMLRRVDLQNIIQMQCLGGNSCILEVSNPDSNGHIFIETGSIIHASVGNLNGERALQTLLKQHGGSFHLLPYEKPPVQTIQGPWEMVLIEAARVCDEAAPSDGFMIIEPETTAAEPIFEVRVEEMLVCSGAGELLYDRHPGKAMARVELMKTTARQAAEAGQMLGFGPFDRVEVRLDHSRVVIKKQGENVVFIRTVTNATTISPGV